MSNEKSDDEFSWDGEKVEDYFDPALRMASLHPDHPPPLSMPSRALNAALSVFTWRSSVTPIELESVGEPGIDPPQTQPSDALKSVAIDVHIEDSPVVATEPNPLPALDPNSVESVPPPVLEVVMEAIANDPLECEGTTESLHATAGSESPQSEPPVNEASGSSLLAESCDSWDVITLQPGQAELSVESALLWCLNPAIYGIKSIGVPSASDRARRLVDSCKGDTSAAVVMASGSESGGLKRTRIIFEFLLRQVPFIGCPAYILKSTWSHLRSVAVIAAIYGHDVQCARTQHEILWCLLPQGANTEDHPEPDQSSIGATAHTVSKILISTAVKRTLGIGMVSDLFQLGVDLWAVGKSEDDSGFEHVELGPAATARNYFCPDNDFDKYKLGIAFVGVVVPFLFRLPGVIAGLILLLFGLLVGARKKVFSLANSDWARELAPKLVSYLVFSLHALIPVWGISSGFSLGYQGMFGDRAVADRIGLLVLSTMALSTGLRAAGVVADSDLAKSIHAETRKAAVIVGVVLHLFPLIDLKGQYSEKLGWVLGSDGVVPAAAVQRARSWHYLSVIMSMWFQQQLLVELRKREVVLKLLGAERVMILSLTLFFRGVTAAVRSDALLPLFRQVTPHPVFCCVIMVVRKHALPAAGLLSLVPLVPVWFPAHSVITLIFGLTVGVLVVTTVWNDWRLNENTYLSHMRLLYILPGVVAGKTKQMVDQMLLASGKSVVKNFIVSYAQRLNFKT
jgi:hypothetical protein